MIIFSGGMRRRSWAGDKCQIKFFGQLRFVTKSWFEPNGIFENLLSKLMLGMSHLSTPWVIRCLHTVRGKQRSFGPQYHPIRTCHVFVRRSSDSSDAIGPLDSMALYHMPIKWMSIRWRPGYRQTLNNRIMLALALGYQRLYVKEARRGPKLVHKPGSKQIYLLY